MNQSNWVLVIIVISQFCCTSLWFAGNGVMGDLITNFNLEDSALGHLTALVQFGFISGTLLFALFTIVDRFSPSKVFLVSALIAALVNAGVVWENNDLTSLLTFRFFTGFFLAGIYPVGMKIATDYFEKGLGKSLGFLVGALVIGTAFPHLLKGLTYALPWKSVLLTTSGLSVLGGLLMVIIVPDGPYRKPGQHLDLSASLRVFRNSNFRSAAFGYFGHMWELYAFWAFVPLMLKKYSDIHPQAAFNIPVLSFCVIGIGGLACIFGGYLSYVLGTKRTAFTALLLSAVCCLVSPLIFSIELESLFIGLLLFWGVVVVADSPLFSTLIAQNATPEIKGTALTIVNCIGFSITIISIQLINGLQNLTNSNSLYAILALGPILGLIALRKKSVQSPKTAKLH
ncbi:MAG: MFS transporter [Cyclobacteriaceae bacterium]